MRERPSNPLLSVTPVAVQPALLVPPTLNHFAEDPALARSLGRAIEECLRGRRRFPHTLLCGPADSGKRSVARAIAKELAEPATTLSMSGVTGPADIDAAFRDASDRGILVVDGLELATPPALRDLGRAASGVRLEPAPGKACDEFEQLLRRQSQAGKRYPSVTVIATTRDTVDPTAPWFGWVERTYYLGRTPEAEAARLRRVLARCGHSLDEGSLLAAAALVVDLGIRTLAAASALVEWIRDQGATAVDASGRIDELVAVFGPLANPERVKQRMADGSAEPAEADAAPAPAASRLILP